VTFGGGSVKGARVGANGRIVFARSESIYDLFSLSVPAVREPSEDLRRHTSDTGVNLRPVLHATGNSGVWEKRNPASGSEVWFFDLISGARRKLGWGEDRNYSHALISPDGRKAAYRVLEPGSEPIYSQPVSGGPAKRICGNCGIPSDWTSDGRHIFYVTGGHPATIGILDVDSGTHLDLIKHPSYDLFGVRARMDSASNGWLAFYAYNGPRTRQIFLAPVRELRSTPSEEWIQATDGAHWDQTPAWSLDGRTIYFVSRHDGFACIMARALDPSSRRPIDPSWAVRHFHSLRQTIARSLNVRGLDALWVASKRIFFAMESQSSDLWAIDLP
jgi:Tol biopolymer transport system component